MVALPFSQVMLFFYMIVLFLIFVIQFSVACACLAVDEEQEINYASQVSPASFISSVVSTFLVVSNIVATLQL